MSKTIVLDELPPNLAAQFEKLEEPTYLQRRGRRIGVLVSTEWYDLDLSSRRLLDELDKASPESELIPEEEVDADIERAIREVRALKK